jgi:hypothetical protein
MSIELVIKTLRERNTPVPKPLPLPTNDLLKKIEKEENLIFPNEYRKFLLEAGDVVLGSLEPTNYTNINYHVYYKKVFSHAKCYGVPSNLIPICETNDDFYCIGDDGTVFFWSHELNGLNDEIWYSMAEWIQKVWIEGNS